MPGYDPATPDLDADDLTTETVEVDERAAARIGLSRAGPCSRRMGSRWP
jgi:hypothetical protein